MARVLSQACDLVCEGGGVKGLGLAGAYSVLYEHGYRPERVAGTSAGAITAALIAAGYSPSELRELVFNIPFQDFKDRSWEDRIPLIGPGLSLLLSQGVYEGQRFYQWMRQLLARKDIYTFSDLATSEGDSRLQVVVSDLTARELRVLPRDAPALGIERPGALEVALAVRMSMSIPLFFEPVRFRNPKTGRVHVLVDGGLLSNFPVWLFDSPAGQEPRWPTFGLLLVEPEPKRPLSDRLPKQEPERGPAGFKGLTHFFRSLVYTALEAHDRLYLERAQFIRTISIPTLGVRTTEFGIPPARAQALYQSGRDAAEYFLSHWDFEAYKRERMSAVPYRRREHLSAELREAQPGAPA